MPASLCLAPGAPDTCAVMGAAAREIRPVRRPGGHALHGFVMQVKEAVFAKTAGKRGKTGIFLHARKIDGKQAGLVLLPQLCQGLSSGSGAFGPKQGCAKSQSDRAASKCHCPGHRAFPKAQAELAALFR